MRFLAFFFCFLLSFIDCVFRQTVRAICIGNIEINHTYANHNHNHVNRYDKLRLTSNVTRVSSHRVFNEFNVRPSFRPLLSFFYFLFRLLRASESCPFSWHFVIIDVAFCVPLISLIISQCLRVTKVTRSLRYFLFPLLLCSSLNLCDIVRSNAHITQIKNQKNAKIKKKNEKNTWRRRWRKGKTSSRSTFMATRFHCFSFSSPFQPFVPSFIVIVICFCFSLFDFKILPRISPLISHTLSSDVFYFLFMHFMFHELSVRREYTFGMTCWFCNYLLEWNV